MKSSNYLKSAFSLLFISMALSLSASTVTNDSIANNSTNASEVRATALLNRLNEIKSVKKNELSVTEKKQLRREVLSIRKEMKAMSGGVYLSVGAIIIVILLLILLL